MEQVFFNVPLSKLEPIFKRWIKEAQTELQPTKVEPTPAQDEFLTIQQASELLHLTKPTIYTKTSRNEIPYMKRGKRLYFSKFELLDYLKAGKRKSNAEIEDEANSYLLNNKKRG